MCAVRLAFDVYEPKNEEPQRYPIILLHGLFMNKSLFKTLACLLSNSSKRTVYCIDMRSHGESPHTEDNNCYLMADDLELFFEDHDIVKASIVSHSISSRPTVLFALTNPDMVEKIVILDFSPYSKLDEKLFEFSESAAVAVMRMIESANPDNSIEEVKTEIRKQFFRNKQTASIYPFLELLLCELIRDGAGYRFRYSIDAAMKSFLETCYSIAFFGPYLGEVLFIIAEKSAFTRDKVQLKVQFPKAEFLEMAETTHLLPLEKPVECVKEICKFLEA